MRNTKLEMKFKTEVGKKYNISVNDANESLEKEEVLENMNKIISENIFHFEDSNLKDPESARYVTTSIKEIF